MPGRARRVSQGLSVAAGTRRSGAGAHQAGVRSLGLRTHCSERRSEDLGFFAHT